MGGPDPYSGYGKAQWANEPYQTINYASAHDNLTLWDKLQTTNPKASNEELVKMNKMSAALVLTSQGIPFFQAGEEMARTKVKDDGSFDENSFKSPDSVNSLKWNRKKEYSDLYNYYKGLITLRKNHKAFRMNETEDIQKSLTFLEKGKNFAEDNVVAYMLDGRRSKDSWENIAVIFNANEKDVKVTLPSSDWTVVVNEKESGLNELAEIKGNEVKVPAKSSYVLVDKASFEASKPLSDSEKKENQSKEETKDLNLTKNNESEEEKCVKTYDDNSLNILLAVSLVSAVGITLEKKKRIV